jgi:hypothetical protein
MRVSKDRLFSFLFLIFIVRTLNSQRADQETVGLRVQDVMKRIHTPILDLDHVMKVVAR